MSKEIWVPKSETKVTVQGENVWVSTEMIMTPQKVEAKVGFKDEH